MPGLLLALLMSQAPAPGALVLVTRRVTASPKIAADIARDVRKVLTDAGIEAPFSADEASRRLLALGVKDPARCEAKKPCIVEFGRQLLVQTVISLDVAQLGKDVSVHAEAYRVETEERVAEQTAVLPLTEASSLPLLFAPFAEKLKEAIGVSVSQPVTAAPSEPAAAPVVIAPRPRAEPGSRVPVILTGALALAFGGAAGIFAGTGFAQRDLLAYRDRGGSAILTRPQADALASAANTNATLGLVCGIGAGVLAVLAAVLFGVGP